MIIRLFLLLVSVCDIDGLPPKGGVSIMPGRRLLSMEEIKKISEKQYNTTSPSDGVIYDQNKLNKIASTLNGREKGLTGHKTKEGKQKSLANLRPFISLEEQDKYYEEFGPYAGALVSDYERDYFRDRKEELLDVDRFNLDLTVDTNMVLMVVMDEIILQRLLAKLAAKPSNVSLNRQVTEVQKRYRENMKALDVTREQRQEKEKDETALDSLAAAVKMLQENKYRRLEMQKQYEAEEEELLKSISLKSPAELDDIGEEGGDDDHAEQEPEQEN